MITPEQFEAVRTGVEDLLAFGEPRLPDSGKIPADWTPEELRTIAEALRRAPGKIHVLQMDHWYIGGTNLRVFSSQEAAEAAALALFNETMLDDVNGRAADWDGFKPRAPLTKIKQLDRLIDWANEKYEWTADCQITVVDLEGL